MTTAPTPAPAPVPPAPLASETMPAPTPARKGKKKLSRTDMAKVYRDTNFATVKDEHLWAPGHGAWASVPRSVGLIANVVIKEAAKKKLSMTSAAGTTYQIVWLNWQGNGMSLIVSELDAAVESGYGGERGITTFRRHMRTLKELGFLDYIEERRGRIRWVLVYNPYLVVKKLHEDGHIETDTNLAVTEKMQAIGATGDFEATEDSDGSE